MSILNERKAAILAALQEDPGLLVTEIAERIGVEVRPLAPLLWRMEEDGQIEHEGRRWFAAPGTTLPE